jgi:hypothetical protein
MLPAPAPFRDPSVQNSCVIYLGPIRKTPNFKADIDGILMQLGILDAIEKYDIECIKPALQEFAVFILMRSPHLAYAAVQTPVAPAVPEMLFSRNYIRFELKGQRNCGQQWFSRSSGISVPSVPSQRPMYGMPMYGPSPQQMMMQPQMPQMQPMQAMAPMPQVPQMPPKPPLPQAQPLPLPLPQQQQQQQQQQQLFSTEITLPNQSAAQMGTSPTLSSSARDKVRNQICYETLYQGYCPRPSCPKLHSGERFEVMRLVIKAQRDVGDFETRRGKGTVPPCENFSVHGQCVFGSQCGYQHSDRIHQRFLDLCAELRTRSALPSEGTSTDADAAPSTNGSEPIPIVAQGLHVHGYSSPASGSSPHSDRGVGFFSSHSSSSDLEEHSPKLSHGSAVPREPSGYTRRLANSGHRAHHAGPGPLIPPGLDSPPNESVLDSYGILSARASRGAGFSNQTSMQSISEMEFLTQLAKKVNISQQQQQQQHHQAQQHQQQQQQQQQYHLQQQQQQQQYLMHQLQQQQQQQQQYRTYRPLDASKRNESSSSLMSFTSDTDPFESPVASYGASPRSSYVAQHVPLQAMQGYTPGTSPAGRPPVPQGYTPGTSPSTRPPMNQQMRRTPLAPGMHGDPQLAAAGMRKGASQEFSFEQVFSGSYSRSSLEDLSNIWRVDHNEVDAWVSGQRAGGSGPGM